MKYMIIDDDKSIRMILSLLIRQNQLGTVVAQLEEGGHAVEGLEDIQMQTVSAMSDELQLMERTARLAMTYGLASGLAYDDDETGKASYFLQLKDEQLQKFMPAKVGSITDVY